MKIAVIVSQVPDTTTKIQIAGDGKSIEESDITWILNPYAEFAIEKALRIKEAGADVEEIILVCMGPERATEALRQGLAMGADRAVLLKSENLNIPALANKIKELGAELVLGGKKTIDTESSWAEAGVAALLDMPFIHCANKLEWTDGNLTAERENSGAKESFALSLPVVVSCDKGDDEPRYASVVNIMKAKKKPLDEEEVSAEDSLGFEPVEATLPPARQAVKIFDGSAAEAAKKLLEALHNDAKVL